MPRGALRAEWLRRHDARTRGAAALCRRGRFFLSTTATESPSGWTVLRQRDVALFCGSRLLGGLGLQMQSVAVGWRVYDLTSDPLALGLVGLATFVPMLLLSLPAGHVADRFDRRLVIALCYLVAIGVALGLLLFAGGGPGAVVPIVALVAVGGATRAFLNPTGQALLPNLVAPELLGRAVAVNASVVQIASVSGPALGGLLYALTGTAVFAVSAAAFALALLLVAAIGHRGPRRAREPMSWASLLAGLAFIRARPVLLGAISLDLVAVLMAGATALLPVYARDILEVGPWGLGLLRSAPAVGAGVMGAMLAWLPLRTGVGRKMLFAVALFGLATAVFGLSSSLPLSLLCLVVIGASDMVSVCVRQTLVQIETPDAMRGRVAAANFVFIGASNELGEFRAGTMAAAVGAVHAVVAGGVLAMLAAVFWSWRFPALRDRDGLMS